MKHMTWFLVAFGLLGVGAGVWAFQSPTVSVIVRAGIAAMIGGNLLLMTWLLRRASPDSGDALVLPGSILLSVAMLVGLVPGLLWPSRETLQIAASIASVALTVVALFWARRRIRQFAAARSRKIQVSEH